LHQAIIGKVGDFDKHILEVSTAVAAMEKVFGKVCHMHRHVNELNTITQRIKVDKQDKPAEKKLPKRGKMRSIILQIIQQIIS